MAISASKSSNQCTFRRREALRSTFTPSEEIMKTLRQLTELTEGRTSLACIKSKKRQGSNGSTLLSKLGFFFFNQNNLKR